MMLNIQAEQYIIFCHVMRMMVLMVLVGVLIGSNGLQIITDSNFQEKVVDDGSFWVVLIHADWSPNSQYFKAQLEGAQSRLSQYGIKFGLVNGPQNPTLNKHAIDAITGQINYPTTPIFIKDELIDTIPVGVKDTNFIITWMTKQFNPESFLR